MFWLVFSLSSFRGEAGGLRISLLDSREIGRCGFIVDGEGGDGSL